MRTATGDPTDRHRAPKLAGCGCGGGVVSRWKEGVGKNKKGKLKVKSPKMELQLTLDDPAGAKIRGSIHHFFSVHT